MFSYIVRYPFIFIYYNMQQKISYQKVLFGFLVVVSLTVLQGCGTPGDAPTDVSTQQNTNTSSQTIVDANDTGKQGTATQSNTGDTTASGADAAQTWLNGTFRLKTTYDAPSWPEPLDATVTLKQDVITAVSAENVAVNGASQKFQKMFIDGISGQIVGKNIKDVNVTYVNGSSLTAEAFNKALHALQK